MRHPLPVILLLAVAVLSVAVLVQTQPGDEPASDRNQRTEIRAPSPDPVAVDSASPTPRDARFAARAGDYVTNAPRRRDSLGRALPFRETAFDVSTTEFLERAQSGQIFSLEPFDEKRLMARVTGRGQLDGVETVFASFQGRTGRDRMFISRQGDRARGLVMLPSENLAYEILGDANGYVLREWLYQDVLCATPLPGGGSADSGLPRPERKATRTSAARITTAEVPVLQSRPGAPHVIYLDFDGEIVANSDWASGATINAPAARMTASQIRETWERVCRDFDPFQANITTVRADYDAAAITRKMHVVITANDRAAPGAGGVAFMNSFKSDWPGVKVCWAFIDDDAKDCAEVISHELGHTFGLNHDGRISPAEEYYGGHGSGETGWAPLMGIGYSRQLTQWSRGEYASANNPEDDLAIIGGADHLPRAVDDHGSSAVTATAVLGDRADGIITRATDTDFFSITLGAGPHTLFLTPSAYGNIDLELQVQTVDGTILATANPLEQLSAVASFSLAAEQTVRVRVAGRGKPEISGTGYSSYGSLGSYALTGFGNQEQPPSAPIGLSTTRVSGTQIRVNWSTNPSAQSYTLYRNGIFLAFVSGTEFLDTTAQPSTTYAYSVTASNPFGESELSTPTTVDTPAFDQFIMDGQPDFAGYLLANPSMTIYAAVRGTKLYVATWSPGDNGSGLGSDHFILVSDALLGSASVPAPWAKAGLMAIGGDKPYLAGESKSTYAAWNNAKGPTSLTKSRLNSGVLEGVIDLVAEFGSVPPNVYVAAVAYGTEDGQGINSQAPTGNGNNNLEPGEFLRIPTAAVSDRKLNGSYDILDAERSFAVTDLFLNPSNRPVLRWPVVPGKNYLLQGRAELDTGSWTTLVNTNAGTAQWEMEFTDTSAPAGARFYRVTQPQP